MGVGVGAGRPVDSISPTQGMGRCQGPPDARTGTKRKRPSTMGTAETSQIVTRGMKRKWEAEQRDAKRRKVSPAEPAAADAGSIEDRQPMPRPNRKPDQAQSDPSEKTIADYLLARIQTRKDQAPLTLPSRTPASGTNGQV